MNRKEKLEAELKRIVNLTIHKYEPDRLILYGSLARGEVHEWSDIDLAVVKNTPRRFIDRIGDLLKLIRPEVSLNIIVYTPAEVAEMENTNQYFWVDEIVKKGKVLYERPT